LLFKGMLKIFMCGWLGWVVGGGGGGGGGGTCTS